MAATFNQTNQELWAAVTSLPKDIVYPAAVLAGFWVLLLATVIMGVA